MSSPRLVLACSVSMLLAATACPSGTAAPKPATNDHASARADGGAAAVKAAPEPTAPEAQPTPPAAPEAQPTPPAPEAPPATPEPAADAPAPNLGAHLADPRWFRKTIFGDTAKILDTKRSTADDQGRFTSLIRFELSDKTVEACADHLTGMVEGEIPNVTRSEKDGRIQIDGNTDSYKIVFICGEAQGKTIAYVSYQWT